MKCEGDAFQCFWCGTDSFSRLDSGDFSVTNLGGISEVSLCHISVISTFFNICSNACHRYCLLCDYEYITMFAKRQHLIYQMGIIILTHLIQYRGYHSICADVSTERSG
nr:MAG TPA_asm: hypothetical protein [Caudoviricetes sp.]